MASSGPKLPLAGQPCFSAISFALGENGKVVLILFPSRARFVSRHRNLEGAAPPMLGMVGSAAGSKVAHNDGVRLDTRCLVLIPCSGF